MANKSSAKRISHWQRLLDSGQAAGMEAIAAQHGVDRTYISRILGLASLAPDIVGDILAGNEPDGISLSRLYRDMPLCWQDQRKMWAVQTSAPRD